MESATEEARLPPRPQPQLSSPAPYPESLSAGTTPSVLQSRPQLELSEQSALSTENTIPALPRQDQSPSPAQSRRVSDVVPPYWQRHDRNASGVSQTSLARSTGINLEDHTADPDSETSRGLWARSVSIVDHRIVQGMTGVGAYVVWNCTIHTLDGGPIVVRMRYSEFDDLRRRLVSSFPHARSALPALPPKSVLYKFRPKFLENRRVGLEYFLNCVLLNPEFSGSPIVKDFFFGRMS